MPDPNTFDGPVRLYRTKEEGFKEMPLTHDYKENSRALGLADMAKAIQTGRKSRASSELIYHVLEIMSGFETSAESGKHVRIESRVECIEPMVHGVMSGVIE